ncbi:MAG: ABC transporter substrate-binding protein, partial [Actinomycetota bacterium]
IDAAGGRNIADDLGVDTSEPINIEALIAAAPDVIVLPAAGLASVGGVDGLLAIPGYAEMPAGQNRRIIAYDDQYLLGNGPRAPALLEEFVADFHETAIDAESTDEESS